MKRTALIALVCAWLAFAASGIVSRTIFERLPHLEDEFAYLYQARIFARGQLYIETPQPVRAYWQPFLINNDGKRFGKYTPGWPLVLAPGIWTGQPWIVNAWLAMLTVALTYRLGREIYNPATGAVAALLLAISPAALLLNGTLMAHTATLFFVTLFLYALWRLERGRHRLAWGVIGGVALGMVALNRPLTAIGVGVPFAVYSLGRILWIAARQTRREAWLTLRPLLALAGVATVFSLGWPGFNYAVTAQPGESFPAYLVRFARGDKDTNLYRYIWDYDTIGFGPDHGRSGHTQAKAERNAKRDLKCAAHDVFGWALPVDPETVDLTKNPCAENGRGYSWLLLPAGFLLTVYRRWTWLLLTVPIGIVLIYMTYWIGGRLYSARYYYEALTAVVLVSAAGLTFLVDHLHRLWRQRDWPHPATPGWVLYGALVVAAVYSLAVYTPARLQPLRGYGRIGQAQIEDVQQMRLDRDRPAIVIAWGDHHWRDIASLMGVTGPFLDDDIVLARDKDSRYLDRLLKQWPDREIIYYVDGKLTHNPPDGVVLTPSP